jgi:hypothetical protein
MEVVMCVNASVATSTERIVNTSASTLAQTKMLTSTDIRWLSALVGTGARLVHVVILCWCVVLVVAQSDQLQDQDDAVEFGGQNIISVGPGHSSMTDWNGGSWSSNPPTSRPIPLS